MDLPTLIGLYDLVADDDDTGTLRTITAIQNEIATLAQGRSETVRRIALMYASGHPWIQDEINFRFGATADAAAKRAG